jgi:hypothetical protein
MTETIRGLVSAVRAHPEQYAAPAVTQSGSTAIQLEALPARQVRTGASTAN